MVFDERIVDRKELLKNVRKVVVKIGTAALSDPQGRLDETRVRRLADQVHALRARGLQAVIVTSGAIGAGMSLLGLEQRPTRLPELQACAAVGQGRLTAVYDQCFRRKGYHAAQMLLTRKDFDYRHRYLNASNTIQALLAYGAVPLINENDTISVEEMSLTFTDNDILAALVTNLLGADMLAILTVEDGLYENPEAAQDERRVVDTVENISEATREMASEAVSRGGRGGMASKIEAAGMVASAGNLVVVANALTPGILEKIFDGETVGTLFLPARKRMGGKKRWMRYGSRPKGRVIVDAGARKALVERGKSLLPSGILRAEGDFERGDLVAVCDESGEEFARGLTNYSAEEIGRIAGLKSAAVRRVLGDARYDEAIHRDHMAVS